MESSILKSTKKVLSIGDSVVFDEQILQHINSAFGVLANVGVNALTGFKIEDDAAEWDDIENVSVSMLNLIQTYVYLKVRLLFDPPTTSFHLTAVENQLKEYEWRLYVLGEEVA